MKLKFYGAVKGLEEGIRILSKDLGIEPSEDGIPVKIEAKPRNIEVKMKDGNGVIAFDKKIHFFRALGLFIEALQQKDNFSITEEPQFVSNGIMLDVSRNAVLRVESIKRILDKMALMGLNILMLYTEDTYEIETKPYFGYMRGRYTYEELKECDDYADLFGIEMIPCIQTLAHLYAVLRWSFAKEIKDTDDIILVGCEKTYTFIEEMMRAASAPFKSRRIHLGMDEAHSLGLGRYLDIHGYRNRFDIMNEHLGRVKEIADRNGLKPMMWSDMYFRLASRTGDYYDLEAEIPKEVIRSIPEGIQLVYWDYYHNKQETYEKMIRTHRTLERDIIFAGGIWVWNGICVNYTKTFATTNAGLSVCKKEGIKEVFATMWGDDGAETSCFSGLVGLQLYAEHGYAREIDPEKLKRRFEFCTGEDYDAFMGLSLFDNIPHTVDENVEYASNPSKYLLWQDVLTGLFDRHIEGMNLGAYYTELAAKNSNVLKKNSERGFLFDMYVKLAEVLGLKSEIGVEIKKAYDCKDMNALRDIAQIRLPELSRKVGELRNKHRYQWLKTCKPFGWEIIDMRYGGLAARIDTAIFRIMEYVSGIIGNIEELEGERLYFDGLQRPEGIVLGLCNRYQRIVSTCLF